MSKEGKSDKGKLQVVGGKQIKVADPEKVKKSIQENIKKYQSVLKELKNR